jgi:hypothetical protein
MYTSGTTGKPKGAIRSHRGAAMWRCRARPRGPARSGPRKPRSRPGRAWPRTTPRGSPTGEGRPRRGADQLPAGRAGGALHPGGCRGVGPHPRPCPGRGPGARWRAGRRGRSTAGTSSRVRGRARVPLRGPRMTWWVAHPSRVPKTSSIERPSEDDHRSPLPRPRPRSALASRQARAFHCRNVIARSRSRGGTSVESAEDIKHRKTKRGRPR